jgi:hypothetical protein
MKKSGKGKKRERKKGWRIKGKEMMQLFGLAFGLILFRSVTGNSLLLRTH